MILEIPKKLEKDIKSPLKIEKYDSKEKINSERVEEKEAEGGKGAGAKEEKVEPIEKEQIKVKKKIRIIKD